MKQGMNTLPGKSCAYLHFGHSNDLLVCWKDKSKELLYYKMEGNKMNLKWQKPLPDGVTGNCYQYITPSGSIVMSYSGIIYMFNSHLSLLSRYNVKGTIRGMIRDKFFVVCDELTEASQKDGLLRLSVNDASKPEEIRWKLDIPADGAYKRGDEVHACGDADGSIAVTVHKKPYIDFYSPGGLFTLNEHFSVELINHSKCYNACTAILPSHRTVYGY